jgi:acyl-CoA synthetase (NDP forming)
MYGLRISERTEMAPLGNAREIISQAGERKTLREDEVKGILRSFGIPTTDFHLLRPQDDLAEIDMRYPAILKVCSDKVLHKTDVGGVVLNLKDSDELMHEVEGMRKRFPGESLLVEPMERGNFELIIGLMRDKTFGLTIMTGIGGILTELYRDVSFRVVPIEKHDAKEMLNELKGSELFRGFRGMKSNPDYLVALILKVSELGNGLKDRIDQMDLNPVFVRDEDAIVVDAKLMLRHN